MTNLELTRTTMAIACLSAGLLAGCVTGSGIDQQAVAQDQTCQQSGFKPGTPGYGNCRLELSRQAAAARADYVAHAWWNQPQTCPLWR